MRPFVHTGAAVALCAALASCGTTVPLAGRAAAPAGEQGLGGPASAGTGPVSGPGDQVPGATQGGPGGPQASVPGGPGPSTGPLAVGPVPQSGRGYDARHVYLGFPTNNDVNAAAGALGLGALNFGDQNGIIDAVVADLNARGGVLGRQVVAVKHDLKTADLEADPAKSAESTCRALTEDNHVVAVVNVVAAIDVPSFYSCLAHRGTPIVSAGFLPVDDAYLSSFAPYLYRLTAASFTRLSPVWLERLQALRYFTSWDTLRGAPGQAPVKVGLLYPAVQPQQRIFTDLHRRLVAKGYTVAPDVQYTTQSLDGEGAAMSNAVLTFASEKVTHVLSSDSDVLLFMQAADKQRYHPRYGLTSYHAPAAALQAIVPASQLAGALGVGWLPISDVDSAHSPGSVGPGETACRTTMRRHGVDISAAGAATVAFGECDGVGVLARAMATSHAFDAPTLRRAMDVAGRDFRSALTWRSALSAARADLPGAVRDIGFDGAAFRYLSTVNRPL